MQRPSGVGAFEFVILASLRAAQLMRGCRPRIDGASHKNTVIAQLEISQGVVGPRSADDLDPVPETVPAEDEAAPALVAG